MIPLVVKREKVGPILGRHPWVFSKALVYIPEGLKAGEPVKLIDERGKFLATGYFNSYSQISVRVWGYSEEEKVDKTFFKRRISQALAVRKNFVEKDDTDSYRVVNSEGDLLPGLVVDKYADYLVVQFHTKGMDFWRNLIVEALVDVLKPRGIYERSDIYGNQTDKPEEKVGVVYGEVPELIRIKENGLLFLVDVKRGQKTGFFLDQRDKRKAFAKYTRGADVLNVFSYTGGFSVYALSGGAKSVINIDTSNDALELAKENVKLNGFSLKKVTNIKGDAKKLLMENLGRFDAIVLDPPAFIKDRRKKERGVSGYKFVNRKAMEIIKDGGILVTCSCSYHLSLQEFRFLLSEVAQNARCSFKILETYTHGIDHPLTLPFIEGEYLKCFFLQCLK